MIVCKKCHLTEVHQYIRNNKGRNRWEETFEVVAPRFLQLCERQGIEPVVEVDGVKYQVYWDPIFECHDTDPVDNLPVWIS